MRIENFKQIDEILREISLFKIYMKKFKFSVSHYARLVSGSVNITWFVSIKRPESKVVRLIEVCNTCIGAHGSYNSPQYSATRPKRPLPPVVYP